MAKKDTLSKYRAKRNFSITPEPEGIPAKPAGNSYLIQKHEASHLHYDFRLELDGALKSWAVPKGPSLDPHDRRLAMEVEDHPVSYGTFEGIIPKGQYGGGTVMLWDRGSWEPVGDPRKGLRDGKLVFKLHGERLQGEWTLVRFHGHEKAHNQWFLIKHRDDEVREGDNGQFVLNNATSILSGRSMEEIAGDKDKVWQSNRADAAKEKERPVAKATAKKSAPTAKRLPGFIRPQLATLTTAMPKGKDWLHEIKFDGYRMLAYIEDGKAKMISRNAKDWTDAFHPLALAIGDIPIQNGIIDGEVVVIDRDKKSDFSLLKDALSAGDYSHMQYYAFDLLFLDGQDLRKLPLRERKEKLEALLAKLSAKTKRRVFYSEHFTDESGKFLQGVCAMHLEGVISKRADAPYLSDRSKSWLKTKCIKREEFVIGGYTLPTKGSRGIGALLLGYYDEGELDYAGRVGTGWSNEASIELFKKLESRPLAKCPYRSITPEGRRKAKWVKPELVCEVQFTEWTPDGHLRHPSFQGLREDKEARDVKRDFAEPVTQAARQAHAEVLEQSRQSRRPKAPARKAEAVHEPEKASPKTGTSNKESLVIGGIKISHPDRVIYPDSHITKVQLAEYYLAVADAMLPHIANRPLSMLRCPDGAESTCFYQRHIGFGNTPNLHEVAITVNGEKRDYLMIKDQKGLLSLVQWGVIEMHPWQCAARQLNKPDRIIFDLDPDPSVPWARMMEAAHEIRSRMEELGLETFLKTTGGKGLHIVVPVMPAYDWAAIKSFARAIAQSMASDRPDRYIATMSKAARKGLIFIDYLRNDVTSTAVAPFSARARKGATVSMPLFWDELTPKLKLASYTIDNVPGLLAKRKKDPWADFFKLRQKINAKYLKALKIVT